MHTWTFFRAGGFDQVRLDCAADLANLANLDQKLWVSLSCPTRGIEFDARTLALLDSDGDGHIRAPELLAAIDWTLAALNTPDVLAAGLPGVPLDAIRDASLLALARALCDCSSGVLSPAAVQAAKTRAADEALTAWQAQGNAAHSADEAAAAAVAPVHAKLDDFFARCALAAFDTRAQAALNGPEEAFARLAQDVLSADADGIEALPLAKVTSGGTAPLAGSAVNPAWAARMAAFAEGAVRPLLGARSDLGVQDWQIIKERLAAHAAWRAARPTGLPEACAGLDDLERLARYVRDLLPLANNFVAFRDFYQRSGKASFQIGTLYLDGRSAELCVAVNDAARHAALATLARMCLVYCECARGDDKMTIAAAFTAGDSDQLIVGRNGVFYDRQGRDWDATISKIIDHPISLRQAFWSPYKRLARLVAEQLQKLAANKAAKVENGLATQAGALGKHIAEAPAAGPAGLLKPSTPPPFDVGKFAGIFAAIGLAVGALGTAVASMLTGVLALRWWQMPLAFAGLLLLVSGPAMVMAWFKLRSRNLGPLLDANGWAVNARARINIPFGAALTQMARLPEGAERQLIDPFAEKERHWKTWGALALIAFVLLAVWTR